MFLFVWLQNSCILQELAICITFLFFVSFFFLFKCFLFAHVLCSMSSIVGAPVKKLCAQSWGAGC
jgi:hypothetical protein